MLRRTLALAAVIVTALLLQSTVFSQIKLLGVRPELLYVVTISMAILEGPNEGAIVGFAGGMLFAILIWRAIRISYLSKDPFGTYVAAGVASMFAIQMFVNVGMVLGIMPITGIPLPFVSYGGSAMLANFIAAGLLLNVHMPHLRGQGHPGQLRSLSWRTSDVCGDQDGR